MNITEENLKMLFQSFGDRNENTFRQVAESLITAELAANHHSLANELKRSLGERNDFSKRNSTMTKLNSLPKDRRYGDDLVVIQDSKIDWTKIVLSKTTKNRVDRVLTEHQKRNKLGKFGFLPKNKLLFWGPPGCGKTMTAFYISHELGLPLGVVRLNALISSFLGDTSSHLQRIFDLANEKPMVLLLDEVDAIGKNRDDVNDVGELKRIVNGLLQAIDFFSSTRSILIAASNHQYLLDPALWRRFDDIVHFPLPKESDRHSYLRHLLNGVSHDEFLDEINPKMSDMSFADIERVMTEAIKTMILADRKKLSVEDVSEQLEIYFENLRASQKRVM